MGTGLCRTVGRSERGRWGLRGFRASRIGLLSSGFLFFGRFGMCVRRAGILVLRIRLS